MDANLLAMAEICAVCNDAGVYFDGRLFRATGLPTEAALKVLVEKMGFPDIKSRNKTRDAKVATNNTGYCNTMKLGW
jgi:Ca2+-transporting ATPase